MGKKNRKKRELADGLKGLFGVILVSFSPTGHFEVPATAC